MKISILLQLSSLYHRLGLGHIFPQLLQHPSSSSDLQSCFLQSVSQGDLAKFPHLTTLALH